MIIPSVQAVTYQKLNHSSYGTSNVEGLLLHQDVWFSCVRVGWVVVEEILYKAKQETVKSTVQEIGKPVKMVYGGIILH